MCENLVSVVTALGSPKIVVAGDFMLDVYVYGDALRISPEAPVPVLRVTETEYRCGGAGSVAVDLAALGAAPICIGVTGDDQNGKILRQKLADAGADIDGLLDAADRPTISKQRLIGLAQHRHRQQLMRIDREFAGPLPQQLSDRILATYKQSLARADAVCLQDYDKGLLAGDICRKMVDLARKLQKKVLIDPSMTADYSKYTGATLITPNRREASVATGIEITRAEAAERAAGKLRKELALEAVVITLDKEGAYLKTEDKGQMIATRARSVYDVTGAGDMVLATLAAALASGCDYRTAVRLSNITGGIEVEKFGTASVSIHDIVNEILSHNRGRQGKLRPLELLRSELTRRRSQHRTIVFTNGCFDVLHRGHIEYLKFCKSQGDIVVVGLNSDNSVRTIKGPGRPINNQQDRAEVLGALESVDYIVIFDEPTPQKLIETVRPHVLVKGEDWARKGVVGREFVESCGGRVVLAPLVEGKSSTATIKRINSIGTKS